jgi:putative ABC transport system permease protein
MRWRDLASLALGALTSYPLRSGLSMLGIGIGVTAVIVLTSIGEGTRLYILEQFTQFGTNILAINPGKTETIGIPGVLGGTTHKLTIEDAEAIKRLPGVETVTPVTFGQARVEANGLGRSVPIYGVTEAMPDVFKFEVRQGTFLPGGDPRRGESVVVLGPKLKRELFAEANALGRFVRIAGHRLRVIGIQAPKGTMMGIDLDDLAWVPVRTAMQMFNQDELIEIDVIFSHTGLREQVVRDVRRLLTERHDHREDFTITTQNDMLEVFGNIMDVITMGVGAIAGISLLVGAVGILTMMWIAVGERAAEIGLVRALGATPGQVSLVFLTEAAALSTVGGAAGLGAGLGLAALIRVLVPGLPVHTPMRFAIAALVVSLLVGLVSGLMPARRAAGLDPIESLRAE